MRFIIFVIDDQTDSGSASEMQAIDQFNAKLVAEEHWIYAAGIAAAKQSVVIDNRVNTPEPLQTPGSLVTGANNYSGFWLVQAPDPAKAHELALGASLACNRVVELRPFLGN